MLLAGATMPIEPPGRRAGALIRGVVEEDMEQDACDETNAIRVPRNCNRAALQNQRPNSEKTLPGRPTAPAHEETPTSPPGEPSASRPEHAPEPAIPPCRSPSPPLPLRKNPSPTSASLPLHAQRNELSHHA